MKITGVQFVVLLLMVVTIVGTSSGVLQQAEGSRGASFLKGS
jgi:hypothetical protein